MSSSATGSGTEPTVTVTVTVTPVHVAIVGATGNIGSAITHALLEYGNKVEVSLLLRTLPADAPAAKQTARTELLQKGARIIDIDLEAATVEQLAKALVNQDIVLSTVGVSLLKDGQLKLVEATKKAGVKRIIPSEFGLDMSQVGRGSTVPPWDFKLDVQEAIKKAGLEYTFIETGVFGEYTAPFAGINSATKTITAPGSFNTRLTISPLADVAKQVADLIVTGRGRNETVLLGTVNYSWNDLHAALERVTGTNWHKVTKTKAEYQAEAKANENDWVSRVAQIYLDGKGTHFPPEQTYAQKHQIPLGDFDQFVKNVIAK